MDIFLKFVLRGDLFFAVRKYGMCNIAFDKRIDMSC